MQVRRVTQDDRAWIAEVVVGAFASTRVVSRGRVHENATMLDGFVVENDGRPVGCALWSEIDGDAELVVIVTTYRGAGAGTALLDAVVDHARAHGWKRLWLISSISKAGRPGGITRARRGRRPMAVRSFATRQRM